MNRSLFAVFYLASIIVVLVGYIFRMQHNPIGLPLLIFGMTLALAVSSINVIFLNRKVKNLEKQIEELTVG